MNQKAEAIRIRYLYRSLILRRKINVPFEAALKIIGPDCAYHLYSGLDNTKKPVNFADATLNVKTYEKKAKKTGHPL